MPRFSSSFAKLCKTHDDWILAIAVAPKDLPEDERNRDSRAEYAHLACRRDWGYRHDLVGASTSDELQVAPLSKPRVQQPTY